MSGNIIRMFEYIKNNPVNWTSLGAHTGVFSLFTYANHIANDLRDRNIKMEKDFENQRNEWKKRDEEMKKLQEEIENLKKSRWF